ncbi:protachykinin-1 [Chaetodon trifascialis]|uniref:protachykinin-1 n=1 Tax=Chaetodon trifascialis TaxID=109706 RepID=UPI0039966F7C
MMELVKLVLIVVLLLTNVFCQEIDVNNWKEGIEESKWSNSEVIQHILVRMTRKPGPRQYLRLMGKKGSGRAKSQTARKRHKFQNFVGPMGKRSFEDQGKTFFDDDESRGSEGALWWQLCTYMKTPFTSSHTHNTPSAPSSGWEREHSRAGRQSEDREGWSGGGGGGGEEGGEGGG